MTLPDKSAPRRSLARTTEKRSRTKRGGRVRSMRRNCFGFLAVVFIALSGCSTTHPQSRCETVVAQICSRAAEAQLQAGTLIVRYSSGREEPRVVPFVVPVLRPDGVLAAEVDCYANTDTHTYSIVRSDLAIPPSSQESVDFLRGRHLCFDPGSFAKVEHPHLQIASGLSTLSR